MDRGEGGQGVCSLAHALPRSPPYAPLSLTTTQAPSTRQAAQLHNYGSAIGPLYSVSLLSLVPDISTHAILVLATFFSRSRSSPRPTLATSPDPAVIARCLSVSSPEGRGPSSAWLADPRLGTVCSAGCSMRLGRPPRLSLAPRPSHASPRDCPSGSRRLGHLTRQRLLYPHALDAPLPRVSCCPTRNCAPFFPCDGRGVGGGAMTIRRPPGERSGRARDALFSPAGTPALVDSDNGSLCRLPAFVCTIRPAILRLTHHTADERASMPRRNDFARAMLVSSPCCLGPRPAGRGPVRPLSQCARASGGGDREWGGGNNQLDRRGLTPCALLFRPDSDINSKHQLRLCDQ